MADMNINTTKNGNRRTRFHGEPLSTNHQRTGPEPTIMEQTNRNISGNQAIGASSEDKDEQNTGLAVGVEESPQNRARTSSENLGDQTGPVTFHGPSQGLLFENAPEVGNTSLSVIQETSQGESKADATMIDAVDDHDNSDIDFSDFESADEETQTDASSESKNVETFKQKWDTPGPLETDLHPMADLPSRRQAIVNATVGTERTTALTRHRGLLDAFIIVSADWATQLNKQVGLVGAC